MPALTGHMTAMMRGDAPMIEPWAELQLRHAADNLTDEDPHFVKGIRRRKPHPPRQYRSRYERTILIALTAAASVGFLATRIDVLLAVVPVVCGLASWSGRTAVPWTAAHPPPATTPGLARLRRSVTSATVTSKWSATALTWLGGCRCGLSSRTAARAPANTQSGGVVSPENEQSLADELVARVEQLQRLYPMTSLPEHDICADIHTALDLTQTLLVSRDGRAFASPASESTSGLLRELRAMGIDQAAPQLVAMIAVVDAAVDQLADVAASSRQVVWEQLRKDVLRRHCSSPGMEAAG
jgi:hypothetical protein